jgi:NADH dehydrogenase
MILVVGATGVVGGLITRQLLEQGQPVRILIRNDSPSADLALRGLATSAHSLIKAGAEPAYGDLRDILSLKRAVIGVEMIVTTANSAKRGGEDNVENVDRKGNRNLIVAAEAAGIKHFIFISAREASLDSPVDFLKAKAETDERLRNSKMTWTILAPTAFMESWPAKVVGVPALAGRPVTLVGKARRRHSFVSEKDVAKFAVAIVENPQAENQYLPIGGPQALSYRDVVTLYEQVLDRNISIKWVAPGNQVPGLPDPLSAMLAAQETYDSIVLMEETVAKYGFKLTPLKEFIKRHTIVQNHIR